eukprot:511812_1
MTTLDKIDILLGKYYIVMGRNDYFIDGVGKFKRFANHDSQIDGINKTLNVHIEYGNDYDSEDSEDSDNWVTYEEEDGDGHPDNWVTYEEEEIKFVEIDNEFPCITNDKEAEILKILKYLCDNLLNNITDLRHELNWENIAN